jgi:16S rRNA (uracil1498-N3)-methyltransferase
MRLTRIHVDLPLSGGGEIDLPEAAAAHLTRVLRLTAGARVVAFDGRGGEWDAQLSAVTRHGARLALLAHRDVERESPLRTVLLQAIARGDKMDFVVQKATELGVTEVVPVLSRRGNVRLDADQAARKREHWQAVAASACEQCGRNRVPAVALPLALPAALAALRDTAAARDSGVQTLKLLLAAATDEATLPGLLANLSPAAGTTVALLAGPEGGFDPEEEQMAALAGFRACRLGPRVLRSETAALAALAALQAIAGDF